MDKEEAQRLKSAIEQTNVDWLRVETIVFNTTKGSYELIGTHRERAPFLFGSQDIWIPLRIGSPREWIRLLIRHRGLPW